MIRWRCLSALATCLSLFGCITSLNGNHKISTNNISGLVRPFGDVTEEYPCNVLAPVLAKSLEFGVESCRAIPLTFKASKHSRAEPLYDLWVTTGNDAIAAGADTDLVDFYEPASLKNIGELTCGQFEVARFEVEGHQIMVLVRQISEKVCAYD